MSVDRPSRQRGANELLQQNRKDAMLKTIPGPTFKIDSAIPCGCRVSRDEDTQKLRLWYCPTHAAAFELLEVLRSNLTVLDAVVEQAAAGKCDSSPVMDAGMRTRLAIRKATGGA